MESKYTSLELSKKLADGISEAYEKTDLGEIATNAIWFKNSLGKEVLTTNPFEVAIETGGNGIECVFYPAYDILNDICCKYAKEFFGEEDVCWKCGKSYKEWGKVNYCEACRRCEHNKKRWEFVSKTILEFIQQGKKQEVEKIIWDNCLFNKKVENGK